MSELFTVPMKFVQTDIVRNPSLCHGHRAWEGACKLRPRLVKYGHHLSIKVRGGKAVLNPNARCGQIKAYSDILRSRGSREHIVPGCRLSTSKLSTA